MSRPRGKGLRRIDHRPDRTARRAEEFLIVEQARQRDTTEPASSIAEKVTSIEEGVHERMS
jgi:hypothetical protein